ncbi:MAG: hypothetical protein Q7V31_03655 [Parvibaculum sp.]|uniref:hypothetical protein n=1 Tax=Parvibaculum sp. TaxID=2024848 RepID=UPI002720B73B|nr:hypothetical protein [Parvibaculum sp.]MDO8837998.1 hypothetical protein [Parvibaculum sp.]
MEAQHYLPLVRLLMSRGGLGPILAGELNHVLRSDFGCGPADMMIAIFETVKWYAALDKPLPANPFGPSDTYHAIWNDAAAMPAGEMPRTWEVPRP